MLEFLLASAGFVSYPVQEGIFFVVKGEKRGGKGTGYGC